MSQDAFPDVDMGFTCSGKEVRNEQKGISILFGYFIEASEIYAEAESFIFIEGEDYRSTMGGGSLVDKWLMIHHPMIHSYNIAHINILFLK